MPSKIPPKIAGLALCRIKLSTLDERRRMMLVWADYLDSLKTGAIVVSGELV